MNSNLENFSKQESINGDFEQTLSNIEKIQNILPENQSELDVSKLSEKTRKLMMIVALSLTTTFSALLPKESEAQVYGNTSNVYGNTPNVYGNTSNVYVNTPNVYNGPTYEEQKDHQKVEIAAGIFYQIFRWIGHNKVHKKHHHKPAGQSGNAHNGPRK